MDVKCCILAIYAKTYAFPGHVVDAMRDNLPIRECGEVVVKRLERTIGQSLLLTFEVPQHLLLLGINADDGKAYTRSLLANGSDLFELFVPVFHILHGQVLIEGTPPKSKGIKDLPDKVAGDVISEGGEFAHDLSDAQGYPYHILILRETCGMRFNNLHNCLRPLGMLEACDILGKRRQRRTP